MFVDDTLTLASLCRELQQRPYVCVDTEFLRDRTYLAKLCLVQVAHDDIVAAIDPLANIDLRPLWELLTSPAMPKVFHSAEQDLEVLYSTARIIPAPLYDTQIAAMVTGHGDQIGYAALIEALLGLALEKGAQVTDWSRRPLRASQLNYALDDVRYLGRAYELLSERVFYEGRLPWVEAEVAALTAEERYAFRPQEAWRRIKAPRADSRTLATLRAVAAWREMEARARNLPRGWIVKDPVLVDIAFARPKSANELRRIDGVERKLASGPLARGLLDAVSAAARQPESEWPEAPAGRPRGGKPRPHLIADLKAWLSLCSEAHQVAPRLLATRKELDALAADDEADVRFLSGWRRELFGEDALAIKQGRKRMATVDGQPALIASPPPAPARSRRRRR